MADMMKCRPPPPFTVNHQWLHVCADQVNLWNSCNRRKGQNRQARGPQTVDAETGEAKEVDAITVMNVIDYPTPEQSTTHFNEEDKAYLLK